MGTARPKLSVVVCCFNMGREAPRTLQSFTRAYQRGVEDLDYEVIVIENGSAEPLDEASVTGLGPEFSYHYLETRSVSPVAAMNEGVRRSRGEFVMLCIDGARILSPGALRESVRASLCHPRPVAAILSWHLGPQPQDRAAKTAYTQAVEDRLLEESGWLEDGYRLFVCSCFATSSEGGWFLPIGESNALTLSREFFDALGGLDERFESAGGGLANLDLFERACATEGSQLVVLLGEGTFHQMHGGVSTNAPLGQSPWGRFAEEYEAIRGRAYEKPNVEPLFLGMLPPQAVPHLVQSAEAVGRHGGGALDGTRRGVRGLILRLLGET